MTNANLQSLSTQALVSRLAHLEATSRARPKDADRLAAEWRACADELNRRPMSEVLATV